MPHTHPTRSYWLRSGLLTLLEKGSGLVFALGTAVLLLRGLSKENFAAWGLFLLVTYFLEMGRSGLLQNALVRYLSLHRHEPPVYAAIATAALALSLAFSILSNLLLWLCAGWIMRTYQAPQLAEVLPVYFATNFAMAFFYHFNFVQQANLEFRGIFWSTFFYRGALFAFVLVCRLAGWPLVLQQLALTMLCGALLGACGSWLYAQHFLQHTRHLDFQWLKKLIAYGKYVLGTNLSTMFYKNIDKLTLGHLIGPAAFALYDAAGKITQLVETPSFSIAAVVFPQSARHMETEGAGGIRYLYERSVGAILALILPFLLLALLFAEPIVWLFAGEQYLESAGVLRITAFFGLFLPFAVQFGTILDSTGRPATNFGYTFFTAALNLALSYVFVARFGLFGAAYATLTGYALSFVLMQRLLRRDFGIRWWAAFGHVPAFYKMGLAMVVSYKTRRLGADNDTG